jgi:pilus assembly protein FimV
MLKNALGGALLAAATHSLALSLGGVQGAAIIGRPLDVSVRVSADPTETAAGLCLEAELLYGDSRVGPSAVTLAVQKLGEEGAATVRVRSSVSINEPIVTLNLRAGCGQKLTRSYALLADFEPQPVPQARDVPLVVAPARVAEAVATATSSAGPVTAESPGGTQPSTREARKSTADTASPVAAARRVKPPVRKPAPQKPVAEKPQATTPTLGTKPAEKPAASGPRLKLDPVELPAAARGAPEAAPDSVPKTTEASVPEAPSPESQKLLEVEKALEAMRADQARMSATLDAVNAQLSQARDERYQNPLVYGLGALSLAALAGLGLLLWQRRRGTSGQVPSPWWSAPTGAPTVSGPGTAAVPQSPAEAADSLLALFPDGDLPPAGTAPGGLAQTPSVSRQAFKGVVVRESAGTARLALQEVAAARFEDLADLAQDVSFFTSLEQWGDALQRIDAFVREHPGASELPYLMRFRLCADRDDKAGLQICERLYLEHFHHPVPTPLDYEALAPGLEHDSDLLTRLSAAWPAPAARELLEQALSSQADDEGALQVRSLEAFQDLLMLHGVLDLLDHGLPEAAVPTPVQLDPTAGALAPSWASVSEFPSDEANPSKGQVTAVGATAPVPDIDLGLDIDLGSPSSLPVAASVPSDEPAVTPAPDAQAPSRPAGLPALDFEFMDFTQPTAPDADGNKRP